MTRCPACSAEVSDAAAFCSACGEPVGSASRMPTAFDAATAGGASRVRSLPGAAFAPGQMVAERYRVVGLLGRGGMGEVYRADDLKLGLPVAIKFLPRAIESDPVALERFHEEVRNARLVSHPHVCRVHDIGEVGGRHFLTMEFVDGEDLATLLRRIGRLPEAKALEIARQICAGVQAAHDRGVLHRDLKPANIMIDGHGRARITDFGLAVAGGEATGELAGTPAYMAPELLAGEPATTASDLYALGLVLYEIFTGARPFTATSLAEWQDVHREADPTSPSEQPSGCDPAVERVILRCLEKDPAKRPRSASQLALALPGGDPLAAAVAAGETPSPQMVAAAGGEGGLSVRAAVSIVSLFAGLVAVVIAMSGTSTDLGLAPMEKSPDGLRDRAREIAALVRSVPPVDSGSWLERDYSPIRWLADHVPSVSWRSRLHEAGAPVIFHYREGPALLVPFAGGGALRENDPPGDRPGSTHVTLDSRGRLRALRAIPAATVATPRSAAPYEWSSLFREAGLDPAAFRPCEPQWVPRAPFDERREWEGAHPTFPEIPLRVSAASFGGKLVYFAVLGPWSLADLTGAVPVSVQRSVNRFAEAMIEISLLAVALLFARRNLRLGRGDRRGATRIATFFFAVTALGWLSMAHLGGGLAALWLSLLPMLAGSVFMGALVWTVYIAVEPYVRRRMPDLLIGWARALEGRITDARVGRDTLIGLAFGAATAVVFHVVNGAPSFISLSGQTPVPVFGMLGIMAPVGSIFGDMVTGAMRALGPFGVLFCFRLLFRRAGPAFFGVWIVVTFLALGAENPAIEIPGAIVNAFLTALVTTRYGLLAATVGAFSTLLLVNHVIVFDWSLWYAPHSALVLAILVALAGLSFRSALGGRALLPAARLEA